MNDKDPLCFSTSGFYQTVLHHRGRNYRKMCDEIINLDNGLFTYHQKECLFLIVVVHAYR